MKTPHFPILLVLVLVLVLENPEKNEDEDEHEDDYEPLAAFFTQSLHAASMSQASQ